MSGLRWHHQYQRIADVLAQRVEQLRPVRTPVDEHIKKLVDAAPPLSESQRARLATLLRRPAPANAAINDPVVLARAAKIFRQAIQRSNRG